MKYRAFYYSLSLRERAGVRGKISVKLPLILSFSRREKEPGVGGGAHYLPRGSISQDQGLSRAISLFGNVVPGHMWSF